MSLKDISEINFVSADATEIEQNALEILEKLLGRKIERADPLRLLLKSFIAIIINQRILIDELAKENLLAYSNKSLEHLGALTGTERRPATRAFATFELKLSAPREKTTIIKAGTRITAGDGVNFAIENDVIFLAGETVKTERGICTENGEIGNGYKTGEVNKIVDPQAFLLQITNLTATEGGADEESNDSFRERIHEAPESFSVAGPAGAYEFFAKQVSTRITDVFVESELPGEVSVYPLMAGGELPGEEILSEILSALNDREIRPLTDKVEVKMPEVVNYDIDVKYWVARSDAVSAAAIEQKAQAAVEDFILWQKTKLGRDINPTELHWRLRNAGVKRVEITSPKFYATNNRTVAISSKVNAIFMGLEDD